MPSSQVLQQWVNLEESFRESVDAVVRQALPLLVRASSEMQLSNGCYTSFFQLLLGLRRLRPWAFQSKCNPLFPISFMVFVTLRK